ncbi:hypothetical protein V7S43_015415 [Phytophthora oleae]|uniref:Uncharacterized protein n=1 Tax=Phytophthora oleae TaxID=2107226 RepID=A0ABD3EZQ0_9STRA
MLEISTVKAGLEAFEARIAGLRKRRRWDEGEWRQLLGLVLHYKELGLPPPCGARREYGSSFGSPCKHRGGLLSLRGPACHHPSVSSKSGAPKTAFVTRRHRLFTSREHAKNTKQATIKMSQEDTSTAIAAMYGLLDGELSSPDLTVVSRQPAHAGGLLRGATSLGPVRSCKQSEFRFNFSATSSLPNTRISALQRCVSPVAPLSSPRRKRQPRSGDSLESCSCASPSFLTEMRVCVRHARATWPPQPAARSARWRR